MTDQERAIQAIEALKKEYPDAVCSLMYTDPLQLLIATRLAAQCTDARVNLVTPALFAHFPDAAAFAHAAPEAVEEDIKSCGLYKTKARDIIAMCRMIVEEFDGKVPDSLEQLVRLPGIGRKTANLIMGDVYHKPAVVVDTHCIRLTSRLGLHSSKDPYRVELLLKKLLPEAESNDFCHRLVLHGRAVCTARRPKCDCCCMSAFCLYHEAQQNAAPETRTG